MEEEKPSPGGRGTCPSPPHTHGVQEKDRAALSKSYNTYLLPVKIQSFDLSEAEAIYLQSRLASEVIVIDRLPSAIRLIAGVDVAYKPETKHSFAAVVICDARGFRPMETSVARGATTFEYIPGLFSFRELPSIMLAMEKIKMTPDLVICDGHGIAHPRRFGLASHLGVLYNLPTIGCAKTRLIGNAPNPGDRRGDRSELLDQGEIVGALLRTQDGVKPVYVSPGHRISWQSACDRILLSCPRYRLPEPIREANRLANEARAG